MNEKDCTVEIFRRKDMASGKWRVVFRFSVEEKEPIEIGVMAEDSVDIALGILSLAGKSMDGLAERECSGRPQ